MYEEQYNPSEINFNLSNYQRDNAGLVANIEDARAIIRNLHKIIQFLEISAFAHLPLNTQSEIALYLVGTYLLTHDSGQQDPQYNEKLALLETLFDEKFNERVKQTRKTLDTEDILHSVEDLFKNFGQQL